VPEKTMGKVPPEIQYMGKIYGNSMGNIYGQILYGIFLGKLTLRPCQIGFGRLVSTKRR
jgi:hypothetical protein